MRTWDRLSATFVRGLKRPGKYYDGGGLLLNAAPTRINGAINASWQFRYQIERRERHGPWLDARGQLPRRAPKLTSAASCSPLD